MRNARPLCAARTPSVLLLYSEPMATFEENVKQLESIVGQLERGDLPLEDSLKLFEDGMRLSSACKEQLEVAEGKIQMLVKQRDGSVAAQPFPVQGK